MQEFFEREIRNANKFFREAQDNAQHDTAAYFAGKLKALLEAEQIFQTYRYEQLQHSYDRSPN